MNLGLFLVVDFFEHVVAQESNLLYLSIIPSNLNIRGNRTLSREVVLVQFYRCSRLVRP